jgi:integrase/recombinase XerD
VLTDDERRALLAQPSKRAPTDLRNLTMMRIMLDAGLRVSEVLILPVWDTDWMSGKLTVTQGKGAKDRILWLNEDALEQLRAWRQKRPVATELLFTTLGGKRVRDNYLWAMVKRYSRNAGIPKNVHPHTLRHMFATDLYRETKNIRLVQKALGHADLSTTMIYIWICCVCSQRVRSR